MENAYRKMICQLFSHLHTVVRLQSQVSQGVSGGNSDHTSYFILQPSYFILHTSAQVTWGAGLA